MTTRVILPFLNEAMHVVMEGVATPEAVDTSMKLGYGLPIGPLALADRMGLDEVRRWMQYLRYEAEGREPVRETAEILEHKIAVERILSLLIVRGLPLS